MRTDSITGNKIESGYCFGDGEFYCESEMDALLYANSIGYDSLEEAYEDEAYYYTEWETEAELLQEFEEGEQNRFRNNDLRTIEQWLEDTEG